MKSKYFDIVYTFKLRAIKGKGMKNRRMIRVICHNVTFIKIKREAQHDVANYKRIE